MAGMDIFNGMAGAASILGLFLTLWTLVRVGRLGRAVLARGRLPEIFKEMDSLLQSIRAKVDERDVSSESLHLVGKLEALLSSAEAVGLNGNARDSLRSCQRLIKAIYRNKHRFSARDLDAIWSEGTRILDHIRQLMADLSWRLSA